MQWLKRGCTAIFMPPESDVGLSRLKGAEAMGNSLAIAVFSMSAGKVSSLLSLARMQFVFPFGIKHTDYSSDLSSICSLLPKPVYFTVAFSALNVPCFCFKRTWQSVPSQGKQSSAKPSLPHACFEPTTKVPPRSGTVPLSSQSCARCLIPGKQRFSIHFCWLYTCIKP